MSLLLSFALAAATAAPSLPQCSWDRPGDRAFTGDVVAAVDRYTDIPAEVRARLKRRVAERRWDDIATIGSDTVSGRFEYVGELRDMHFASGEVCARVTRSNWPAGASERGFVYCDSGHCIIVSTLFRNVARVTRLADRVAAAGVERGDGPLPRAHRDAGAAEPATPAPSAAAVDAAKPAALPSVAAPPSASFEQLAPDLTRPGPGLVAPAATEAATASGSGSVAPLISVPNLVLPPLLVPAAEAAVPALGDLRAVLPVLAWTTPFGLGPVPLVQSNNGQAQPIPEPGTWAMWIAGLAVVVYLARRRRR